MARCVMAIDALGEEFLELVYDQQHRLNIAGKPRGQQVEQTVWASTKSLIEFVAQLLRCFAGIPRNDCGELAGERANRIRPGRYHDNGRVLELGQRLRGR